MACFTCLAMSSQINRCFKLRSVLLDHDTEDQLVLQQDFSDTVLVRQHSNQIYCYSECYNFQLHQRHFVLKNQTLQALRAVYFLSMASLISLQHFMSYQVLMSVIKLILLDFELVKLKHVDDNAHNLYLVVNFTVLQLHVKSVIVVAGSVAIRAVYW